MSRLWHTDWQTWESSAVSCLSRIHNIFMNINKESIWPILQWVDIWISMKIVLGDTPSPDRSYKDISISKEEACENCLGRHNHHLHGLQNSRTTTKDPHNSHIAYVDNPRWQKAGQQPWIIKKPQQGTTTINHHNQAWEYRITFRSKPEI